MNIDERIYKSNCDIKYFFKSCSYKSDYLIVIFSGFNSPESERQISYNYIAALNEIDCNKLYILDSYGPRGSYYIGKDMNFEVETSVISLVTYIASEFNIVLKNIISVGSSKGGSAALYFGLKYNFGNIISGAPQTRIADYIISVTPATADYMLGNKREEYKIDKLNNIIFKQIDKHILSKIYLFTSENDWQYQSHIEPLIKKINEKEINIDLIKDNNMKSHRDIAKFFPEFLQNKLLEIILGIKIEGIDLGHIGNKINFNCKYVCKNIRNEKGDNIRLELHNGKDIYKYKVKSDDFLIIDIKKPGNYKCSIYFYGEDGNIFYKKYLNDIIIGCDKFNYIGYRYCINNNYFNFELNIDEFCEDIMYAFYILKNGQTIKKIWYTRSKRFEYKLDEIGKYKVQFFIKAGNNEPIIGISNIIDIFKEGLYEISI